MSVFSANISHRSFYWQISALCFVLGLLLAAAWNTAKQLTRAGSVTARTGFYYGSGSQASAVEKSHFQDEIKKYESEVKKLRERTSELERIAAKGTDAASTLNKELQDTKILAGLTEVEGPGVQVTLVDSQKHAADASPMTQLSFLVHDQDIARVVNEFKAAGAEAIAVNGQRVVASTAIRCVGPVVHVNDVPTAPPYVIQAIGNPETLWQVNMPGGVLEEMRRFDPAMVHIEKKKSLHLPAFAGSTTLHFAKLPKSSQSGKEETR
ncbi:MAG TPA: DUF881 domain-containing protein [Chthonomonadaceae bacterium]|nr:DUF881 domain-containing protein [Chthonomonadaceae bacterium]